MLLVCETSASAPVLPAAGGNPITSNVHNQSEAAMHIPIVNSHFSNSNLSRTPDPTCTKTFVKLTKKANASSIKFAKVFSALALEANIQVDSFQIIGDALDSRFEIQFTNNTCIATRECFAFVASLSLGCGKYKPLFVENDVGEQNQFFCNICDTHCIRNSTLHRLGASSVWIAASFTITSCRNAW